MATYDMGLLIRQMRHERGITQEKLCIGLCPVSTLSRIERGLFTPSSYLFRAIMERLGCYSGKYYSAFLNKDDFNIWRNMEALSTALSLKDLLQAESLIKKLWGTKGFNEGMGLQLMLNAKVSVIMIRWETAKVEADDLSECLRMATESLNITIPNFDEGKIGVLQIKVKP